MNKRLKSFFSHFGLFKRQSVDEWQKWYREQKHKIESGEGIDPPWIALPNSSPIHGWNQGYQEAWRNDVWIVFWNSLDNREKLNYLNQWNLPSEEWRETIMNYWN